MRPFYWGILKLLKRGKGMKVKGINMEYSKILADVLAKADELYRTNENTYESYDNVKKAVEKYNVRWTEITFGLKTDKDIDCKKIIWQIILDLRFSRNTESLYGNSSDSQSDAQYLHEITEVIEKSTDEFNSPALGCIAVTGIDNSEYQQEIKEKGLV